MFRFLQPSFWIEVLTDIVKDSNKIIARIIDHWIEKVKNGKSTKYYDHMVVTYVDEKGQVITIDTLQANSVIFNSNQYFSDIPTFPDSYASE